MVELHSNQTFTCKHEKWFMSYVSWKCVKCYQDMKIKCNVMSINGKTQCMKMINHNDEHFGLSLVTLGDKP